MIHGPSDNPRSLAERACDAAIVAANAILVDQGAKPVHIFVTIHATDLPEGEPDCATAGAGYDDARELLTELATALSGVGSQIGVAVSIVPLDRPIGEG